MHEFDRDTALTPAAPGVFDVTLERRWWIVVGPNGGYLAAIILKAMTATVDDPARSPRSLTVHYVAAATEGPASVSCRVERHGGRLSTLSARMEQDGKLIALATAAFSSSRPSHDFLDLQPPKAPAPSDLPRFETSGGATIPLRERFETRPCVGAPLFSGGEQAHTGGWIRFEQPRSLDHAMLALLTDAWPPAIFARLDPSSPPPGVPTVDLTIHFREPLPYPDAAEDDYYLVHFYTRGVRDGFLEEDGEVWSKNGLLLAQARQLAAVVSDY